MYSVCKMTHPATGIEHAVTCNFFNRSEKSLVVAGANVIRVLRLIPDVENKKKPKNMSKLLQIVYLLHKQVPIVYLVGKS